MQPFIGSKIDLKMAGLQEIKTTVLVDMLASKTMEMAEFSKVRMPEPNDLALLKEEILSLQKEINERKMSSPESTSDSALAIDLP